jgi:hypothetical protein
MKSFSRDDERPVREWIEEHTNNLLAQFKIAGARKGTMRVTTMRFDGWMVKGLDGITNMLLERASVSTPVQQHWLESLQNDLSRLERVLENSYPTQAEPTDSAIFEGVHFLVLLIHNRINEQGIGGLYESEKGKLKEYVQRIKVALTRFRS